MTNEPSPLKNVFQMARILGVSTRSLKMEANAGRIPCLKIGAAMLFNQSEVERVLSDRAAASKVTPQANAKSATVATEGGAS